MSTDPVWDAEQNELHKAELNQTLEDMERLHIAELVAYVHTREPAERSVLLWEMAEEHGHEHKLLDALWQAGLVPGPAQLAIKAVIEAEALRSAYDQFRFVTGALVARSKP